MFCLTWKCDSFETLICLLAVIFVFEDFTHFEICRNVKFFYVKLYSIEISDKKVGELVEEKCKYRSNIFEILRKKNCPKNCV